MKTTYEEFLDWACAQGLEFPCTAQQFHSRAAHFAAGDAEIIDQLCSQGIGPDWQEQD